MIPGGFLFLLLLCLSTLNGSNAYCERDDSLIESGRECRKTCEGDTDCKGVKNCYCDGACGMTCFNKLAECEEPGIPNMGTVRRSRLTWGGRAYYTCNAGFAMIGEKMAICNADKKWSPAVPTCEAGCTRPDDVPNSFPSVGQNAFIAGVVYEFLCSTGYYMTGNSTRKCIQSQSTYEWSESQLSCHLAECGLVDHVDHGTVQYTKEQRFGSIATLECDAGYALDDEGRTTRCFSGREGSRYGEWVGELSTCSIITCPDPITPTHGSIRDARFIELGYNSRIAYECEPSYKLRGSEIATCRESGQWDEAPTCVEDPDCKFDSSATPTCSFKNLEKAWTRQGLVVRTGFQGYALESTRRNSVLRSIQIPLEWADDFICLHFYYKIPIAGWNGMLTIKRRFEEIAVWESHKKEQINEWLDSLVQFNSADDLFFSFTAAQAGVILDDVTLKPGKCENHCRDQPCKPGGKCVNRADQYTCFCTEAYAGKNCQIDRRCSELPGTISNGYKNWEGSQPLIPNKQAKYRCDDGFKRSNFKRTVISITITCVDDTSNDGGRWDTDPSRIACEAITCDHPEIKINQEINKHKARWLMDDTVEYQCISGFEVDAGETTTSTKITRTCHSNGQWSGAAPDCIRPFCTYTSSSGMKVIDPQPRYNVGFAIKLECELGYRMIGNDILRCVRKNKWNHSPSCTKNECGRLPHIPNANIPHSGYVAYKETYTYTCISGYYNVRDLTVTCKYDGEFTTMPQCKRMGECDNRLRGPDNGSVDGDNMKLTFSCERMYRLIGSRTSFCDGKALSWTNSVRRCEELQPKLTTTFEEIQYLVYMKNSIQSNYEDSKKLCNSIGGNLVIFYNDQVLRKFNKVLKSIDGSSYQIWIALKYRSWSWLHWDDQHKRTIFPVNQNSGIERNWDSEYPKRRWYGDCAVIDSGTAFGQYRWKNKNCKDKKSFICQRNTIACKPNPCKNNGICNYENEQLTCRCMPNFSGPRCQNEYMCRTSELQSGVLVGDKGKYSVDTEIILDCENNKILVGERLIKCEENGTWSNTETSCEEILCNFPQIIPQHGYLLRTGPRISYPAGEQFPLACNAGFKMTGDAAIHCNWNGQWAQTSTVCESVNCPDLNLPENVEIISGQSPYTYGTLIKLGCIKGSEEGEDDLECQVNGEWAPKFTFSCIIDEVKPCGAPSLPDFAFTDEESGSYPSGTKITLKCVTGQEIVGSSKWQCVNGEWPITSTSSCKVNICNLDSFLLNDGVKVDGFTSSQLYKKKFAVNEEATLICEDSTQNVQSSDDANSGPTIRCRLGGKWSTDSSFYTCG